MKIYEFDGEIKKSNLIDATFVEFPYDVENEFGIKGQVKVKALLDNYEYRGSLVKMGHYCYCIGITKKIRKEINKQAGDLVHIIITKDNDPRIVTVPEDVNKEFDEKKDAKKVFYSLSYTNQKKYIDWITIAKKIETREKRLKDFISMLLKGTKKI